jgi:hypothetical protein
MNGSATALPIHGEPAEVLGLDFFNFVDVNTEEEMAEQVLGH